MEKILVLDFGGQYNQLIARRVRDHHVYAEILPYTTDIEIIKQNNYKGIIFTGGPNSVYDMASPHYTKDILNIGVPILGICYGCQLIAWMGNGEVKTAPQSEYGKIEFTKKDSKLFKDVDEKSIVWMSHTDYISQVPNGFEIIGTTDACPCAAMQNTDKNILSKLGLEKNQANYKIISIDDARENGYNLQTDLYFAIKSEASVKKYKHEEEIYNLIAKYMLEGIEFEEAYSTAVNSLKNIPNASPKIR